MKLRSKVILVDTSALWLLAPLAFLAQLYDEMIIVTVVVFFGALFYRMGIQCNRCGKTYADGPALGAYLPFRCPVCGHDYSELDDSGLDRKVMEP